MAVCLNQVAADIYVLQDGNTNCSMYALSVNEFQTLTLTASTTDYELNIDTELYSLVSGWLLFSFVSGHVLGRILKSLGKF
ncbi:hypothetical protein [Vibrio sp. 16]|uniref:hypothetical protein n=1 Tax=Vibrio sp. 16 TaxID=391586 RepID=UPI0005C4A70A|nr:hypothetical protein [Vibrio sp. 16]CAK4075885.1 hypothetical protein VDT1_4277 [Vibrio sp. 16]